MKDSKRTSATKSAGKCMTQNTIIQRQQPTNQKIAYIDFEREVQPINPSNYQIGKVIAVNRTELCTFSTFSRFPGSGHTFLHDTSWAI